MAIVTNPAFFGLWCFPRPGGLLLFETSGLDEMRFTTESGDLIILE